MRPLFKFISQPDDVKFLLQGYLKFTSIPELNDPSELLPNVIPEDVERSRIRLRAVGYSDEDLIHLRHQGALLDRLAPDFKAIPVPTTKEEANRRLQSKIYDNLPFLGRQLAGTAELISSRVGLFCLTMRVDSLPMWAHYAQNAAGLVVEFSKLHSVFLGDNTGVLRQPRQVQYERERGGVTFDPHSHESLFFSKFEDWKYEQEVRVVLPLDECRRVSVPGRQLYLFSIEPSRIKRIILGWRMTLEAGERVLDLVRAHNPAVEVVQAQIEKGRVLIGGREYPT